MKVVEGVISDVLGTMTDFLLNGLLPWAWDNKFWFISLIPVMLVIVIAKYLWD